MKLLHIVFYFFISEKAKRK